MTSKYVQETGRLEDIDGIRLVTGVDHDTVTIGYPGSVHWRLDCEQAAEFIQLCQAARDQAQQNGREIAELEKAAKS